MHMTSARSITKISMDDRKSESAAAVLSSASLVASAMGEATMMSLSYRLANSLMEPRVSLMPSLSS